MATRLAPRGQLCSCSWGLWMARGVLLCWQMTVLGRRGFILGLGLLGVACLSPTLPLPPPSRPTVEGPNQQGLVTLEGDVEGGSTVFAANMRSGEIRGQFTGSDGHYRFEIPAEIGDELELWYQVGTTSSPSIVFTIPK